MGQPLTVGLIGCGAISRVYLDALAGSAEVRVVACADRVAARAGATAAAYPGLTAVPAGTLPDLSDVELVLNLTVPAAHAEVAAAAVAAGKHTYGEKPLAVSSAAARSVLAAAERGGVRVGCAPDTMLAQPVQTARQAVDAGLVGVPVAATAFMTTAGHERWHPDPEFYYRPGGGPLFDMGPYYLSALVTLLGPVRRVLAAGARPRSQREIGSGPRAGTRFDVEVDTHVTGVVEHDTGALSTLLMSFDVVRTRLPWLEVYGTEGSLSLPDPNTFDGTVTRWDRVRREWLDLPPTAGVLGARRGIGLLDMARAIRTGRPHHAGADVAYHVLEVMEAMLASAGAGAARTVTSTCRRPGPLPLDRGPERWS